MAANIQWIAGDELELLDQLLLEDDLFDADFKSSIESMPKEDKKFPCLICSKICLSSGGLKRHVSAIHEKQSQDVNTGDNNVTGSAATKSSKQKKVEDILHAGHFKKMVRVSLEKIKLDECYPEPVLSELSAYNVNFVEDVFPCYHEVTDSIMKFKGDPETFYPTFYAAISSNDVFPGLSKECQLILGFELANHVFFLVAVLKRRLFLSKRKYLMTERKLL